MDEDNNEIKIDDNGNAKFIKEYKTTPYEFTVKCYHGEDFDFTINVRNGYRYQVDLTIDYHGNQWYNEY